MHFSDKTFSFAARQTTQKIGHLKPPALFNEKITIKR
jgi:hypothetical protein